MHTSNYSDQELIDIWQSWGIEFLPEIRLATASYTLRTLEKNIDLSLKDKYAFIQQLPSYLESTLKKWCVNSAKTSLQVKNDDRLVHSRLEWSLFCLDLQGRFTEDLAEYSNSEVLSPAEVALINRWVKDGLDSTTFHYLDEGIKINHSHDHLDLFRNVCINLLHQCISLYRVNVAEVLGRLVLLSFSSEPQSIKNKAEILSNWGKQLAQYGYLNLSLEKYQHALALLDGSELTALRELDLDRVKVRGNMGNALSRQGRLTAAIEQHQLVSALLEAPELNDRRELDPVRVKARGNLGIVLRKQGHLAAAIDQYHLALALLETPELNDRRELDPVRVKVRINLGNALQGQGHLTAAIDQYHLALALLEAPELNGRRELDPVRVKVRMNLGLALQEQGHLAAAIEQYNLALALLEAAELNDRRELDPIRARVLMSLGNTLQGQGHLADAIDQYHLALALLEAPELNDRRELDPVRADVLMNLGVALQRQGHLAAAIEQSQFALALLEAPELNDRRELDPVRVKVRINLGIALLGQGHLAAAIEQYQLALALLKDPELNSRRELDPVHVMVRTNLGIALQEQGHLAAAIEQHQLAINLFKTPELNDLHELDPVRIHSLGSLGNALLEQGHLADAIEQYQLAMILLEGSKLNDRRELDPVRVKVRINLGIALLGQGHLAAAIEQYQLALALLKDPELNSRRELDPVHVMVRMNLGVALLEQGHLAAAIEQYQLADQFFFTTLSGQPHLNPLRCHLYFAWLKAFDNIDPDWAQEKSLTMAAMLELSDWREQSFGEAEVSRYYALFHRQWFRVCIDNQDYESIPLILSDMQGRKQARILLDELDQSELQLDTPEAVKAFKQLRRELREIAAKIRQKSADNSAGGGGTSGLRDFSSSVLPEHHPQRQKEHQLELEALQQDYQDKYTLYAGCRDELTKREDYQYLLEPNQQTTTEELTNLLCHGQSLLLLVDLGLSEQPQTSPGEREAPNHLIFAWILTASMAPQAVRLDTLLLSQLMDQMQAEDIANARSLSTTLREGATTNHINKAPFKGWDYLERQLAEQLWEPLREHMPDTEKLFVVTQGRFHQLPLTLGCPWKDSFTQYPGLLFFKQAQQTTTATNVNTGHAAITYSGQDLKLAPQEGQLLASQVWSKLGQGKPGLHKQLPRAEGNLKQHIASLYFSCHGDSDKENPDLTHLNLGQHKVTFHEILRMKYRPTAVFIGACVAGQTFEDSGGDPLGPVTAFMLRDVQIVIACLTPVPDEFMPLLSLLTEFTARQYKEPMDQALATAKKRLTDWQTHKNYAHLAQPYREWLQETLTNWINQLLIRKTGSSKENNLLRLARTDKRLESFWPIAHSEDDKFRDILAKGYQHGIDYMAKQLTEQFMAPPQDVIDLLNHSVRAFGSEKSEFY